MHKRDAIRRSILAAITESAGTGRVDVNALAIRISTANPQSGMLIDEICAQIEHAMGEAGIVPTPTPDDGIAGRAQPSA